jgi:hypothetical protein
MEICRDNLPRLNAPFSKPETLRIASTRYLIAIRRSPRQFAIALHQFHLELSRRLRRPLPRHGKIPSSSVMPCTFDMDDVLLYVKENQKPHRPTLFSSLLVPTESHWPEGHKPVMPTE